MKPAYHVKVWLCGNTRKSFSNFILYYEFPRMKQWWCVFFFYQTSHILSISQKTRFFAFFLQIELQKIKNSKYYFHVDFLIEGIRLYVAFSHLWEVLFCFCLNLFIFFIFSFMPNKAKNFDLICQAWNFKNQQKFAKKNP